VIGITAAVILRRPLWRAKGGDPDLDYTVAIWGVPAGIIGGWLYHDVASWNEVTHNRSGWLAIWQSGLGTRGSHLDQGSRALTRQPHRGPVGRQLRTGSVDVPA
jgi:prolipoprotein diacylglyceryltransferase